MGRQTTASIALDRAQGRLVVSAVAMEFSVPNVELCAPNKGAADVIYARQISMYLMGCVFGTSLQRIGAVFGRNYYGSRTFSVKLPHYQLSFRTCHVKCFRSPFGATARRK